MTEGEYFVTVVRPWPKDQSAATDSFGRADSRDVNTHNTEAGAHRYARRLWATGAYRWVGVVARPSQRLSLSIGEPPPGYES